VDILGVRGAEEKALRRRISLVLQDPFAALDPRARVGAAISEPLAVHKIRRGKPARAERVAELLELVGLPVDFAALPDAIAGVNDKLIVTTALEPFSLYIKVSLYAAICLSVPFLLFQIWAFVSPGLYPHERGYVTPFIFLSSVSFVIGAAFAYYVLFPPAAKYLLGLGQDFRLLLKADDYFDFIILVMLGMGLVFQMPAITYVLARIGIVNASFLIRVWKTAAIVILIAAAVLSPTSDIPNMMLFAAPMFVLYFVSIFIAWIFGKPRTAS